MSLWRCRLSSSDRRLRPAQLVPLRWSDVASSISHCYWTSDIHRTVYDGAAVMLLLPVTLPQTQMKKIWVIKNTVYYSQHPVTCSPPQVHLPAVVQELMKTHEGSQKVNIFIFWRLTEQFDILHFFLYRLGQVLHFIQKLVPSPSSRHQVGWKNVLTGTVCTVQRMKTSLKNIRQQRRRLAG